MVVGEAFLGEFLQVAINRLGSCELLKFALKWGVDADLKRMKKVVLKLLAVINDAEAKQFKNELVRLWLDELKDVVYDAEDVLDLFETELLRWKLNQPDSLSHTDYTSPQVGDRMTSSINSDTNSFSLNIEIEHKIKEVTGRLEDIAKEKNDLGLMEGTRGTSAGGSSIEPRLPTSSLVNEPHVYGRDKDVEKMIQLLLSKEPCDDNVCVIPVVGQGGIGKTTFAQLLYNHTAVKKHFDLRAWVCVSDVFDVIRITKGIIESTTSKRCDLNELSTIHDELKKTLEGMKFLLILDDVWTEKYEDWNALSTPFRAGSKGSKVIITTRSEKVSSNTQTVSAQHLELLSEEDCFSLFKRHAFQNQNGDAHPALARIGKEIVKKCKGLPLAAKALGGVMRSKQGESEWEDILNSEIWDLLDQETELGPALWLSYYHLPTHLKRCFVYSGIFPKDYEFDKKELIYLWMAEGFVRQKDNLKIKKRMEDIGEGYFYELVSRSFFQQSSENNSKFVMHDLINDLARAASGETCFTMDDEVQGKKRISNKTRHLTYQKHEYNVMGRFEAFYGANKLRTFMPFNHGPRNLPIQVPHVLLSRLVCLRVLCLQYYVNIVELPESIGNLVHMRYLDLSYTSIRRLPESINALCNLQTLLLRGCWNLKELACNMGNLINLRYLGIDGCSGLKKMSRGIGRLKELQMLPRFIVDENNGPRIEDLTKLEHLRGTLEISGLESIRNPIQKKISLRNKQHLQTLELIWHYSSLVVNDSHVQSVAELLLDRLQPHANLKGLTIKGYYGTSFPNWLEDPSCYSNLVNLHLLQCKYCKSLPNSLGQLPFLEKLFISGMPEWEEWTDIGRESERDFPRLRNLQLQCCPKLKIVSHCFPALVELRIDCCGELTGFSRRLASLNHLSLGDCDYELLQNVASFTPLLSLKISQIRRLTCLPYEESFLQCLTTLEGLEICDCHDLTSLWNCNEVVGGGLQHHDHLTFLKTLEIRSCHNLEKISDGLNSLTFLKKFAIVDCPAIKSFPEETELPTMLKCISIRNCRNLKSLPEVFFMHKSLEELEIEGCSSLNSFSRRDAGCSSSTATINISKLKRISISNCDNLESLPESLHNLMSLELLSIFACSSLTSFPNGGFPTSKLREITIRDCQRLMSLPDQMHCLSCLERLVIYKCPRLLSFPEGGLPSTKLRYLQIICCEDLKFLPNQMILLTSLELLRIIDCPNLLSIPEGGLPSINLRDLHINYCKSFESLADHLCGLTSLRNLSVIDCPALVSFPKGSFPSNLQSLGISIDCNTFLPSSSWEFHFCRFTSLRGLRICGCEGIESFPDWLLPCTLTSLHIWKFLDLKALPKGLQHLTSLEGLTIVDCPKLASLPDQGLPTTLRELSIYECPLLKQWCENHKREEWSILGKIPRVEIDSKPIYDLIEL